jgi:hypothetical protein
MPNATGPDTYKGYTSPNSHGWPTAIRNEVRRVYGAYRKKYPGQPKERAAQIAWATAEAKYPEQYHTHIEKMDRAQARRSMKSHHRKPHFPEYYNPGYSRHQHSPFRHRPQHRAGGPHGVSPGHRGYGYSGHTPSPHISTPKNFPIKSPGMTPQGKPKAPGFMKGMMERNQAAQGQGPLAKPRPESHGTDTRVRSKEEGDIIQRKNQARMERAQARDLTQEKQQIAAQHAARDLTQEKQQIAAQHAAREVQELHESRSYEE